MRVDFFSATAILGLAFFPGLALAQAHGGGGSAGHAGGGSHVSPARAPMVSGSFASRAGSLGTASLRPGYAGRPFHPSNRQGRNWTSSGLAGPHIQDGHGGHDRNRHVGYGYGAVGYSFFPYSGGYWDGSGTDINYDPNDPNQQPAANQPDNYADNNPPQVPYAGPEQGDYPPPYAVDTARAPYNPQGPTSNSAGPASDGLKHPEVTLIFKDGRATMHIQNYALSQTKIFVRDNGDERDIAISELDIQATQAANDRAGVDFALPLQR